MRLYAEIQRVDDDQRMVWGYASTEARATDGLVIARAAVEGALDDYMAFANVREMHQLSAVGVTREASVDDGGLYIGAQIVDDSAWAKVKGGVYRGFSLGAKVTERDPDDKTLIRGIRINEISLVDRPGDPGAVFDVWRAAGGEPAAEVDDKGNEVTELATAVVEDPAQAALERAEQVLAASTSAPSPLLPGIELRRGLGGVAQLGYLLSELAYALADAEWESQIEGDTSPVPAKLRDALRSLAVAYKAMSDEELAEMLNGVGVDVSLENGIIALAAASGEIQRTETSLDEDTIARISAAVGPIIPAPGPAEENEADDLRRAVAAVSAERDTALASVAPLTDAIQRLSDRVEQIASRAAPPKTVALPTGIVAVDKAADSAGSGTETTQRGALSNEDVQRALAEMPADERALLLTRAALASPIPIRTR